MQSECVSCFNIFFVTRRLYSALHRGADSEASPASTANLGIFRKRSDNEDTFAKLCHWCHMARLSWSLQGLFPPSFFESPVYIDLLLPWPWEILFSLISFWWSKVPSTNTVLPSGCFIRGLPHEVLSHQLFWCSFQFSLAWMGRNNNSSRFGKYNRLFFDEKGTLVDASATWQ